MSWNIRVMKHNEDEEPWYGIHEVYYDEDDNPRSWTMVPVRLAGSTPEEIQDYMEKCKVAFTKPTLDYTYKPEPEMNKDLE